LAALSDYVGRQFKEEYQLSDDRMRLIRNGVNIDPFRNEEGRAQGKKLRSLYDPNKDKALFLFAAENLRLKGLAWLIRAADLAVRERPDHLRDFRIMVVSRQGFHAYWKLAYRLGLEQHILFMGPTTQMPALLNMCDAAVLPTFNDACSRLVLEALAAGKPAITTRYNGAADFLQDGKYGYIIDQGNDNRALADGLLQFCDPECQQRMSQAIETDNLPYQVSIQRHISELIALYEELSVK
jgi:UDP-glucose:(heptosyl)LPS alpha-1,3-glucosyltransferase